MQAYCYYEDSPKYSLDQTSTYKAIAQLQLFADRYPLSSRLPECNQLIDKLESKLEHKSYEIAKLYYHMEDYKAAVTCFRNLLNDFPTSPNREECMFLIIMAQFKLAENSIEDKKNTRYNEALTFYGEFSANYPNSTYKEDADQMAVAIRLWLEKANNLGMSSNKQ